MSLQNDYRGTPGGKYTGHCYEGILLSRVDCVGVYSDGTMWVLRRKTGDSVTRITAEHLTQEKCEALLSWLQGENLDPAEIVDDGRFSVHNGWVSGSRYIKHEDGKLIANMRRLEVLKVPFKQRQKNPLPEVLEQ